MTDTYDEKYLEYLDKLRESDIINMFQAGPINTGLYVITNEGKESNIMTDQKQCEILQLHQDIMGGKTDLIWFEAHITYCLTCQQIMNTVKKDLDNAIEESGINK